VRANQCLWHSLFAIFVHYFGQVLLLFGVAFCIHKGSKYSSNWCILQSHQLRLHLAPKCSWECITLLSKIVVFKLASGVASNTNFKHFCWPLWLVIVASFSLLVFLQFGHFFWSMWSILCALFSTQSSLKVWCSWVAPLCLNFVYQF